jgi:hypothetical protein
MEKSISNSLLFRKKPDTIINNKNNMATTVKER